MGDVLDEVAGYCWKGPVWGSSEESILAAGMPYPIKSLEELAVRMLPQMAAFKRPVALKTHGLVPSSCRGMKTRPTGVPGTTGHSPVL